jgi:hypothetical protein
LFTDGYAELIYCGRGDCTLGKHTRIRIMIKTLCSLALFTLLIATAQAVPLAPGGTVLPAFPADWAGPVLGDTGLMPFSFGSPLSSGTVREAVIADSMNPFGAGDLTFVYQVTDITGDVARLSGSDYTGWLTDVGVSPGHAPFVAGAVSPATISRTADGSVVGFNFSPTLVGATSLQLLIRTNATTFGSGSIGVIDGGGLTLVGFAPAPEPAYAGLLLGGLFGLGLLVARRFQAKQS